MLVYKPAQNLAIDGYGPRYTNMYETNGPLVACGERRVLTHLTFRLPGGFAGPWLVHHRLFERVSLARLARGCA